MAFCLRCWIGVHDNGTLERRSSDICYGRLRTPCIMADPLSVLVVDRATCRKCGRLNPQIQIGEKLSAVTRTSTSEGGRFDSNVFWRVRTRRHCGHVGRLSRCRNLALADETNDRLGALPPAFSRDGSNSDRTQASDPDKEGNTVAQQADVPTLGECRIVKLHRLDGRTGTVMWSEFAAPVVAHFQMHDLVRLPNGACRAVAKSHDAEEGHQSRDG